MSILIHHLRRAADLLEIPASDPSVYRIHGQKRPFHFYTKDFFTLRSDRREQLFLNQATPVPVLGGVGELEAAGLGVGKSDPEIHTSFPNYKKRVLCTLYVVAEIKII